MSTAYNPAKSQRRRFPFPPDQRNLAVLLALALLMLVSILLLDPWLASQVEPLRGTLLRGAIGKLSPLGDSHWYLIAGALVFVIARYRHQPRWKNVGAWLFTAVAASGLAAIVLKAIIGRARPELLFDQGIYGFFPLFDVTDKFHQSLPSGHAATAGAVAALLWLALPRVRWAAVLLVALVSLNRIVLASHFAGDVIAGLALGAATTVMLRPWFLPGDSHGAERT